MGNPRAILLSMGNSPRAAAQERVWFGGGVETLNTPALLKYAISLEAGEGTTKYSYACFLVQVYIGVVYVCVFGERHSHSDRHYYSKRNLPNEACPPFLSLISRTGFPTTPLQTCETGSFFVVGLTVHCRVFSSIPHLYSLDARNTSHPVPGALPNQC